MNTNTKKMNAIICNRYGPPKVLKYDQISVPIPKNNEVLIQNHASSINTVDILHRGGKAPKVSVWILKPLIKLGLRISFGGLFKPKNKVLGASFAGEIVSIGKDVSKWKIGDQVYGYSPNYGACAEYLTAPSDIISLKPQNLSFNDAAAVPGGISPAIAALRDAAQPEKGQEVLIIGASGGIGTFGIQLAKLFGSKVIGVCGPNNVEMIKKIGADEVIDYSREKYLEGKAKYDIIYDVVGVSNIKKVDGILKDNGVYIANNPTNSLRNLFWSGSKKTSKRLESPNADESASILDWAREKIEAGKISPVLDKIYPLHQTAEAHKHYETGHSKGRVVINIK